MKACLLCNSDAEKRLFIARERMYASNEEFEYLECTDCGSVQIREPPSDLSRFYPRDYYSMLGEGSEKPTMRGLRRFLRGARTNYCINRSSSLGWFINKVAPNYFDINREWFAFMSAPTDAEILDVGCGAGELMFNLHVQGFSHLTGIDPFVSVEVTYPGFQLRKATLSQLDNKYHLIMLHHSLEHMADPLRALTEASKLLSPGGYVLIRLPVIGTYGWRRYRLDWIGLDAPRHLFVPTTAGMKHVAQRAGFTIKKFWFDSTAWTLLLSEMLERGLRLDERGFRPLDSIFETQEIAEFQQLAKQLNEVGDGDTACFILTKNSERN